MGCDGATVEGPPAGVLYSSFMADESEFDDKRRRSLFGANAQAYGDGRPDYPSEVFDHLRSSCGLRPGCRVLEIGPGTGQATGPLLDAGAELVAVELGDALASHLRERFDSTGLEVRQDVLIPWTTMQTADQMQRFLSSFSSWMALDTDVRTNLLQAVGDLVDTAFGGVVERPFLTAMYSAPRL